MVRITQNHTAIPNAYLINALTWVNKKVGLDADIPKFMVNEGSLPGADILPWGEMGAFSFNLRLPEHLTQEPLTAGKMHAIICILAHRLGCRCRSRANRGKAKIDAYATASKSLYGINAMDQYRHPLGALWMRDADRHMRDWRYVRGPGKVRKKIPTPPLDI